MTNRFDWGKALVVFGLTLSLALAVWAAHAGAWWVASANMVFVLWNAHTAYRAGVCDGIDLAAAAQRKRGAKS